MRAGTYSSSAFATTSDGADVYSKDLMGCSDSVSSSGAARADARLRTALRAAQMTAWEWDLQSGGIAHSENVSEIFGQSALHTEEAGWAAIHPDDVERLRAIVDDAIDRRSGYVAQVRYIRPDTGAVRWIEIHGSVFCDASHTPAKISGVILDVTDRREAEEALRQSEERFRAFVTATADVVYRMSADWSEMRQLVGQDFLSDTADPSRAWLDKYIPPEDQAPVTAKIREAIHSKSVFELEHRVFRADGTIGWTFSRAIPLCDAHGGIIEWFGAARDVTKRKLDEEAFAQLAARSEQQRRLYETILSNTPDLVYVFNVQHRFTYANKALLTMWGKTWEEAIGKNCLELGYEPWHAAMHDREIEQVVATKQPIRGEVPFNGTQGRRIYDYIFVPVIGTTGEVEAVAGTTRDVTERKLAEEDLRQANEDLQQFAYSASHDLQEPLRGVSIYSELLVKRYGAALDGQALEFLNYLQSGAKRMESLVRDLLAYTEVMKIESVNETADGNEVLKTTLANLDRAAVESNARITFSSLPCLRIQSTHLQQLFQHLIGNAIKYCSPERRPAIHIHAERQGRNWLLSVADNGIGIDPTYKEHIFGLFKRLHTSQEYSGTGIGLAICQRIVERYHGRIWAESQPGQGSIFWFSLPV